MRCSSAVNRTLLLCRAARRTATSPFDAVSRRSVRAAAVSPSFPSGESLSSTASAEGEPSLFGCFIGIIPSSDFSSAYMPIVRLCLHGPVRCASPDANEISQFPCKELLHVHKVSDCARFYPCKPLRHGQMLSSLQANEIGTSEVDPFRSSILGPWSPFVNASRRPSRDAAHHLGSGWLARPSPFCSFTSYSLPANWRTPCWVMFCCCGDFA